MNKDEFLSRMERALAPLAPHDRIDILGDYVEHFRAGEESGKSDEDIAAALGSPEELAQSFLEQKGKAPSNSAAQAPPSQNAPPYPGPGVNRPYGPYVSPASPGVQTPYPPYNANQTNNQTVATVLVVLFNVFVGVPFILSILGMFLAVPAIALGLFVAAFALFSVSAVFAGTALAVASIICFGIAALALAILMVVAVIALVRLAIKWIGKYIQFCVRICREGRWPVEGGCAAV